MTAIALKILLTVAALYWWAPVWLRAVCGLAIAAAVGLFIVDAILHHKS